MDDAEDRGKGGERRVEWAPGWDGRWQEAESSRRRTMCASGDAGAGSRGGYTGDARACSA